MSGPSAIYVNPVSTNAAALTTSCNNVQPDVTNLATSLIITSADATAINAALSTLGSASSALNTFCGFLSNLGTYTPSTGNVPNLSAIIGLAYSASYSAGGALGTTSSLIAGMTTSLGANPQLSTANTYVNGIVAALTASSTTPAAVETQLGAYTTLLNGLVTNDTNNYHTLQTQISNTNVFLSAVSYAKSTDAGVQAYIAQVIPAGTLATLKTVPV